MLVNCDLCSLQATKLVGINHSTMFIVDSCGNVEIRDNEEYVFKVIDLLELADEQGGTDAVVALVRLRERYLQSLAESRALLEALL